MPIQRPVQIKSLDASAFESLDYRVMGHAYASQNQDALIHFLGGVSNVERRVSLSRNGLDLGSHRMLVHAPGIAFRLTVVTGDQRYVETHIRRLLALTNLKAIQWINLNHAQIEFTTVRSKAGE